MNIRIENYVGRQTLLVAQLILCLIMLQLFIVDFGNVDGVSMEPTLVDQQPFLINRAILFFRAPKRYEVIQFFHPSQENFKVVKRVVGLPGETIEIRPGEIRVTTVEGNRIILSEPYLREHTATIVQPGQNRRFVIPYDTYYVLGDNRVFSSDSRIFGVVHRSKILGVLSYIPQKQN